MKYISEKTAWCFQDTLISHEKMVKNLFLLYLPICRVLFFFSLTFMKLNFLLIGEMSSIENSCLFMTLEGISLP